MIPALKSISGAFKMDSVLGERFQDKEDSRRSTDYLLANPSKSPVRPSLSRAISRSDHNCRVLPFGWTSVRSTRTVPESGAFGIGVTKMPTPPARGPLTQRRQRVPGDHNECPPSVANAWMPSVDLFGLQLNRNCRPRQSSTRACAQRHRH
jgi:hypothetical protein